MKKIIIQIVFFILARSLKAAVKFDKKLQEEIQDWPENYLVLFKVLPAGPLMALQKQGPQRLIPFDKNLPVDKYDLVIFFKNVNSAFRIFTALQGVPWAFAEHRMSVKGHLPHSLSLIRCLDRVQTYLFPKLICKTIMKKVPSINFFQKLFIRTYIYVIGIPFGI